MTTLDNTTLQFLMDKLGYSEIDYLRPVSQTLTFGADMKDYRIYTLHDLRMWLVELMNQPCGDFIPTQTEANRDELPTHLRSYCSCGEWETTIALNGLEGYDGFERVITRAAYDHVEAAKKAILDRYEWDMD